MRQGTTPPPVRARHPRPALLLTGLIVLATVPVALGGEEYLPDARLGTRTAPILLLSRPDVQSDLGLSPEQVDDVSRTIEALHRQADALRGQPDTPEVVAARRAIDQSQTEWIQTRLSVEQQTRLLQVDLQWEGPSALLTRPFVAEALGLDARQRRTLAEAVARAHRLASQGGARQENVRRLAESALTVLTEDQKARWQALLGHPFAVQATPTRDPAVQTTAGSR